MVDAGAFREDLYFRLEEFQVALPPLRERREDIPLLAIYFMHRMAAHLNKEVTQLTREALSVLQSYDWPGNVRELEHAVKRGVIVSVGPAIRAGDIALGGGKADARPTGERMSLEEHERSYIREVLEATGWVISGAHGAAAILGLHPSTLRGRMRKLGIVRQ
jgi:transcriptional regulator with GAF, ATPase, and Fis domain